LLVVPKVFALKAQNIYTMEVSAINKYNRHQRMYPLMPVAIHIISDQKRLILLNPKSPKASKLTNL